MVFSAFLNNVTAMIIVGTAAGIGYTQFLFVAGPYCIIAFVATLYLVRWLFKIKPLTDDASKAEAQTMVDAFDE